MVLALRLNEQEIIRTVYQCIPRKSIELIVAHFPQNYLYKFLGMLAGEIQHGRNVEWANHWLSSILKYKAGALAGCKGELRSHLLQICQQLQFFDTSLTAVVNENKSMVQFMKN